VTDEKVIRRSPPPDRVHGIVLEKQESLVAAVAHPRRDSLLHPPRIDVRDSPQPGRMERLTQG
jgi:hypothetical protein